MNWNNRRGIAHLSTEKKQKLAEEDSCCEHVEVDPSCAAWTSTENDSFGIVGRHVNCQACQEAADKEEEDELVVCHDCSKEVRKGETYEWKWYDFYGPQGDEPLVICDSCRAKPKHQERMSKDRADYEAEFPV